jgi:orotidine-5'-phosphate decarboxylase
MNPDASLLARERLIVALDFATTEEAHKVVTELGDTVTFYKIGLQLQLAPKLRKLFKRLNDEGIAGADYLVIGRPITRNSPREAARRILGQMEDAFAELQGASALPVSAEID